MSNVNLMQEISLFPIPNVVAFPGTVIPLHVFEPRYRTMVTDCLNSSRIIGVCHTKKEISPAPRNQTVEETLSANQATYKPFDIFSAGECEIIEETSDGRILANIYIANRYIARSEVQTLPYRIVSAELLEDEPLDENLEALCASVHKIFLALIKKQNPSLAAEINESNWPKLSPSAYSFKLFQFIRLEPNLMQSLLASTSAKSRLERIHEVLKGNAP